MKKTSSLREKAGHLIKETFIGFVSNNGLRLSAALTCYIFFSLTPMLIIFISLGGIFFGERAVKGEVFDQLNGLIGERAALAVQDLIKTIKLSSGNTIVIVIGIGVTIFAASRVFAEIQSCINLIWEVKTKHKRVVRKYLMNRLMSFSLIGSTALLLLVGLIANSLMDLLDKRLMVYLPELNINLYYVINLLILFLLIIILFTVMFKILPDGKIAWLDCLIGASFTAVLFMIGKFAIGAYLGRFAFSSFYGAAGTLLLILTWVYYSAIIFYFGATFTKVYAHTYGEGITPNTYSVRMEKLKS